MYALLFIIPVLVSLLIAKLVMHVSFTWKEMAVQAVFTSLVIGGLFLAGSYSQTYDVKFVNGVVDQLDARKETCPSGWRDWQDGFCTEYRTRRVKDGTETCTTNSSTKQRTCVPNYKTQYNYIYDWERRYFVHADYTPSSAVTYEIDRIDRQGVNTPPRFAAVKIGDPVTKQEGFTNYIRAASDSLFSLEPPGEEVPLAYPKVHEQWLANRVIVYGVPMSGDEWGRWNDELMVVNSNIRKTGANAIIVLTAQPQSFSEMLARAWEAHNINDVVTVIGVDDNNRITWVDVRSWSSSSMVDVAIRDGILGLEVVDTAKINAIIQDSIQDHFKLRSMEEFEYLAEEITPPLWVMILAGIILLIVTPAVTYVFHREDVFGDE